MGWECELEDGLGARERLPGERNPLLQIIRNELLERILRGSTIIFIDEMKEFALRQPSQTAMPKRRGDAIGDVDDVLAKYDKLEFVLKDITQRRASKG